jgi:uncharacterized protein YeeX (DUF496 family)
VKIGRSKNPEKRLKQLSTGSPYKLEIIKKIRGNENLEREIHDKFSHLRMNGEWFELTDELSEFIESR